MNASHTLAPSPEAEARAFWRMRWRLVANALRQTLAQARLRVLLVLCLSALFWGGLFFLFLEAFEFLTLSLRHVPTRDHLVQIIFGVFFAALLVMLGFSAAVLCYGLLYRSHEPRLLLVMPARPQRVFLHKFQEALLLSSWGFLLLGSPMFVAYGLVAQAPWHYYLMLAPLTLAFVWIPCSLGALACLVVVRFFPRAGKQVLLAAGIGAAGGAVWLLLTLLDRPHSAWLSPSWFREMLTRLQFSQHRLLPSWWLSSGLLEASRGGPDQWRHLAESVRFLAVLLANALVLQWTTVRLAARWYRASYDRLHSRRAPRRHAAAAWIDWLVLSLPLPRQQRLLVAKDAKLFRRDPVQWSQFLVFFGLLGIYFINLRPLIHDISYSSWIHAISFLNLAVVGLILSTFTSRFIYPMISLEGRRFWILSRLPLSRRALLWSKFLFALCGALVPCVGLVILSDFMLQIPGPLLLVHLGVCLLLCTGLSSIAVGLGARWPNLHSENPTKIAAGFGGTLTLVTSALYILLLVALAAVPSHFYFAPAEAAQGPVWDWGAELGLHRPAALALGLATCVALGLAATFGPMWLGLKSLKRLEV